ncbi:TLD domain-containing protein, putative [Eimeria brunetti]|uniref:Oxidation resistance protein 1 n=1 Tax=Eimeria brunetti TaxID=51314 RepID=U6LDQ8_9EIME|nr:TLD domain-containing protein, putative [Eimeria brunetti]
MGEAASRLTSPAPLNPQKLTEKQLQQLLSHFGLNELSPSKARISLLGFVRAFPGVLQGHAMLLLPTLKEIARQQQTHPQSHGLSFAILSSSSLVAENGGVSTGPVGNSRCGRASKKQMEALKTANSIALQEVIDSISSCCSGEAPETEMLLTERMLGRIARSFEPSALMTEENEHVRQSLESIGGLCIDPKYARKGSMNRSASGSVSSSGSRRSITYVSLGCSTRACVALLQLLQYGYLELTYLLNPNSLVFQDKAARTTSGLSCNQAQEIQTKGMTSRGVHTSSAWDTAPALRLMFPTQLNFTFALRSMAAAFAEAAAPTSIHAATPTAAAVAAAAVAVTQIGAAHFNGNGNGGPGMRRGTSSAELAAQASGAVLHASTATIGSGGLRNEVFAVLSWIKVSLPVLPALCTLGVAAHLLGDTVFDGQPQPERNDSSLADVQYTVYAPRRRHDSRSSLREAASSRGRGDNGAAIGLPRAPAWKRSPSAEAITEESKGWHGQGTLDARSKCFTDEHAFVLRMASTLFPFPPKAPWTCLYASWKHGTSFSRLCANCFFYSAPMVAVVKTEEGQVLGAIISCELKEGGHTFFGDANTCLFSVEPQLNILRTSGLGRNFVYLNTKNKFHPIGLGFGGQVGAFRFWIGDEMKDCYITKSDCTYSPGRMLQTMNEPIPQGSDLDNLAPNLEGTLTTGTPSTASKPKTEAAAASGPAANAPLTVEETLSANFLCPLHVKELEIWGTGDASVLEQQKALLKQQDQLRQERRQVDKGRLVDSGFDREFLLGGTFTRAKGPEAPSV